MSLRSYRGDAPAFSKVQRIAKPTNYVAGAINIHINNKTISWFEWDLDALIEAWNTSLYPETQAITASSDTGDIGQYGNALEALLLTADNPGEDFFVHATIGDSDRTNEIQTLLFDPEPDGGTFTLTFSSQTTAAITFVAGDPSLTAANIYSALVALSNIGSSDVSVEAISDKEYRVTFAGVYAETDVPSITCDYTNLTGGDVTLSVTTIQQGVLPVNEIQTLSLPSVPTGGTFTLTFIGQTTSNIAYNASAATVQAALVALSNIVLTDVVCTGGSLPATPIVITFGNTYAATDVPLITGNGTNLTGTTGNVGNVQTVANGSAGTNQKTLFSYPNPASIGGLYSCETVDASGTVHNSAQFAATETAANIKAAFVGMTVAYSVTNGAYVSGPELYQDYVITAVDIDVTGSIAANTLTVEFKGAFAATLETTIGDHRIGDFYIRAAAVQLGSSRIQFAALACESQSYDITDATLVGSYTLTVYDSLGNPHTTAAITYGDNDASDIASKINTALGGTYVGVHYALGADPPDATVYIDYLFYGYQVLNITVLSINDGSVQVAETTKGDPGTREVQDITPSSSEVIRSGTFTITYSGQTTTAIAYNANAGAIQTALEALSNLAPGDIVVSGGPIDLGNQGGIVNISWSPSFGNIGQITVSSSLVDSILTISDYITGGLAITTEDLIRNAGPECFDDPLNYDPQGQITQDDDIVFEFGQNNCKWGTKQRDVFSVESVSLNRLQLSTKRWLFQDGQKLRVKTTTTLPGGLSPSTSYFVINSDGFGRFQLSATLGGSAINITDAGTGEHTIGLMLKTITKPARYAFDIGLPRNNGSGFEEYRPRYLEAWVTDKVTLGERQGQDSSLQRYNFGDTAITGGIDVLRTASSNESDMAACGILIESSTTDLNAWGGDVGLAPCLDEESEVQDINCHGQTALSGIGPVACRDITLERECSIKGNFAASGSIRVGV